MVTIVTGNGLGLFNTSLNTLGGRGVVAQSGLGQSGGQSYVNAATGNLVLQFQDERLSGSGMDLLHVRTYNALGTFNDGDADGWRWDGERKVVLTGTRNSAGSSVARTAGDGSVTTYTWDATNLRYFSTDGTGAHDILQWNGSNSEWEFIDGSSRVVDRYDGTTGLLKSIEDTAGDKIFFTYSGVRLTNVKDTKSSQEFILNYDANNRLANVDTRLLTGGALSRQVYYAYNAAGRLTSVTTDLTPNDNSIVDNNTYVTTYGYDANNRIISITQSDGTSVSFTYVSTTDSRIKTVTDSSGVNTLTYNAGNTTVSDGNGKVWTYYYDAKNQLTEVRTPTITGGSYLSTKFQYDTSGNVTYVTDARNNKITYKYDSNGNCILECDALGNTIKRTFDSKNQLVTETRYRVADSDGADIATNAPSDGETTRFVYDVQSRLRFMVSAEGRVTEYRYASTTAPSSASDVWHYTVGFYDTSTLLETDVLSESSLATWVTAQDKTKTQLTHYDFDYRGNVSRQTSYAAIDSVGNGVFDAAATVTEYVYDEYGMLLQTIAARGATHTSKTTLSSTVYDGLGRVISVTNAAGTSTTSYNGIGRTLAITNTAGLTVTQAYDTYGRLISSTESATGANNRLTSYYYDNKGQLVMVQAADGARTYSFYDEAGRVLYRVDGTGATVGFTYNNNNQVTAETRFKNVISSTSMSAWFNGSSVTKTSLTKGTTGTDIITDASNDRVVQYQYDNAGRLTAQIDAANVTTTTSYDGTHRITQQQTLDRVTRFYYDRDGRQVGVLDSLGYLTEHKYDATGQRTETIKYFARSSAAVDSAPVWPNTQIFTVIQNGDTNLLLAPASDADGQTITYSYVSGLPAGLTFDAASRSIVGKTLVAVGNYNVVIRATANGVSTDTTVTLSVSLANQTPTWAALTNQIVGITGSLNYTLPAAVDPEAGALTYSVLTPLPTGISFNSSTRVFSGAPTTVGTYTITVNATDARGAVIYRNFDLTVNPNAAPTWPTITPTHAVGATAYSYTVPAASDFENQSLTYAYVGGLPSGLTFTPSSRIISGTCNVPGTYSVTLKVTDVGGLSTNTTFSLIVDNQLPTWTTIANDSVAVATNGYSKTLPIAVDPEGQSLTYSIQGSLPPGLSFTPSSRVISGTPTTPGTYTVVARVTDFNGGYVDRSFVISVTNAGPVWPAVSTQNTTLGNAFNFTVPAATDPEGQSLTYRYISGLPAGLTFDPSTRIISGTTTAYGTYTVTIEAKDPHLVTSNLAFTIFVNRVPTWSTLSAQSAPRNVAFSTTIPAATEPDGQTLTYSVVGSLPPGISFNSSNLVLSGTPSTLGAYTVTLRATDSFGASVDKSFSFNVTNSAPVYVSGLGTQTVYSTQAINISAATSFSDPNGDTLTYSAYGIDRYYDPEFRIWEEDIIALPTGLNFSSAGVFSGQVSTTGNYLIEVNASDPSGAQVSKRFTLSVLNNSAPAWPAIANQSVPPNVTYSFQLPAATDAEGQTITYSLDTALPTGLTFNASTRTISGTPTVLGTYTITARATDSVGGYSLKSYTLTVTSGNLMPVYNGGLSYQLAEKGLYFSYTFGANTFTDPNGDTLTYTATGQPTWLSLSSATKTFSGTPVGKVSNSYNIVVTASDGKGGTATGSFTLEYDALDGGGLLMAGGDFETMAMSAGSGAGFDALSGLRPTSDSVNDLHMYTYYDAQGRVKGVVDDKQFLTEYVYGTNASQTDQQQIIRYANVATVNAGDSFDTVKARVSSGAKQTNTTNYDAMGRVLNVTNAEGTLTDYQYDAAGRLQHTVLAKGTSDVRTQSSSFNAWGDVIGTLGGEGGATLAAAPTATDIGAAIANKGTRFVYDTMGRRIQSIDANNNSTWSYYDNQSRVTHTVRQTSATQAEVIETTYTVFGQVEQTRNYTNRLSISGLTGGALSSNAAFLTAVAAIKNDSSDKVEKFNYDNRGLLKQKTDAELFTTDFTYTSFGELYQQTQTIKAGSTFVNQFAYDKRGALIQSIRDVGCLNLATATEYDAFGRVIASIDAANKRTTSRYDNFGRTVVITDPLNASRSASYDAFGRVLTQTDALGNSTTFAYNDSTRTITMTTPEGIQVVTTKTRLGETLSIKDGRGNTNTYTYNKDGQLKTAVDALNNTTTNTYNNAGQLISVTDARGIITQMEYDAANRVIRRTVDYGTGTNSITGVAYLNIKTLYEFDGQGRQIKVTEGEGSSNPKVTQYNYDKKGQVLTVTVDPTTLKLQTTFTYDGIGNQLTVARGTPTNSVQQLTVYHYDKTGRRVREIIDPAGLAITTQYKYDANGNVTRKIDANGNSTWYSYNALGNLIYTIDALGAVSKLEYDSMGRVVKTRQLNGTLNNTQMAALSDNNKFEQIATLVTQNDSLDHITYSLYDKDSRLKYSVNALGNVLERVYDANGNVITEIVYDKAIAVSSATSAAAVKAALTALGYSDTVFGSARVSRFAYDNSNRLRFEVNALGFVSESIYNAVGNLTSRVQFVDKPTLSSYSESVINTALSSLRSNALNRKSDYVYDAGGQQRFVRNAAGYLSETIYDGIGRVKEARQYNVNASSTPLTLTDLTSVVMGKSLSDGVTRGEKYDYDSAGRLTKTTDAKGFYEQYGYDAVGNRIYFINKNLNRWDYSYDKANRLTDEISPQVNVATSTANGAAITTRSIATHMSYDAYGNVTSRIEDFGGADARETNYQYDKLNRQTKTLLPGSYDAANGQFKSSGGDFRRTVEVGYDVFGNAVSNKIQTGASSFIYQTKVYDLLGRVTHEIDALNQITAYTYNKFGEQETVTRFAVALNGVNTGTIYNSSSIATAISGLPTTDNRVMTFAYNAMSQKISVKQINAAANTFVSVLTDNVNAQGQKTSFTGTPETTYDYDAFGNAIKESTLISSGVWSTNWHYYDALNRKIYDIDAGNFHTSYRYDAFGNMDRVVEFADAGNAGTLTALPPSSPTTDVGNSNRVTEFSFDALNRRSSITRKNVLHFDGSNQIRADKIVWRAEYDNVGNLTRNFDALNNLTLTEFDALGRTIKVTEPGRLTASSNIDPFKGQVVATPTITYALNAHGQALTEVRNAGGGRGIGAEDISISHRFDAAGLEIATTDALHNTTYMEYDGNGNVSREYMDVNAALGNNTSYSHRIDKRYVYDLAGRQIASVQLYDNASKQTGQVSIFNSFGEVVSERQIWGAATLDLNALRNSTDTTFSKAETASYKYDKAGRVIEKRGADGTSVYFYDLAGRNTRVEQRGNGNDSDGITTRVTETVYDLLGRAQRQRLPQFTSLADGATTTALVNPSIAQEFDRWGNVSKRTDVNGSFTTYEYDQDNRVVAENLPVHQAWANSSATATTSTQIRHEIYYDVAGRAVRDIQKINGTVVRTRKNDYDAVGHVIKSTDGTGVITEYAYDAFGNQVGTRNGVGTVFVDTFDAKGQQLQHSVLRRYSTSTTNVSGDYYISKDVGGSTFTPQEAILEVFSYDQAGRRYSQGKDAQYRTETRWRWVGGNPRDPEGDGEYVSYTVQVLVPGTGTANYYYYDERGLMTKFTNATNISKTSAYDYAGRKIEERDALNNTLTWTFSDGKDGFFFGQLKSRKDLGGHVYTYSYNEMGQTASEAQGGVTRVYTYLENGLTKSVKDQWIEVFYSSAENRMPGGSGVYGSSNDVISRGSEYDYNISGQRTRETHRFTRTGVRPDIQQEWVPGDGGGQIPLMSQPFMEMLQAPGDGGTYIYYYTSTHNIDENYSREIRSEYDLLGRLQKVIAPAGNEKVTGTGTLYTTNGLNYLTYGYDANGNRVKIDASYVNATNTTSTSSQKVDFDNEGRVINENGTRQDYDAAGRLFHSEYMGRHVYRSSKFDDFEDPEITYYTRQTKYTYTDTGAVQTVASGEINHGTNFIFTQISQGYDANLTVNDVREYDGQGFLTKQTTGTTVVSNIYLNDGRLSSSTTTKNGLTSSRVAYTGYDAVGNMTAYSYSDFGGDGVLDFTQYYTNTYAAHGYFDGYKQTQEKVTRSGWADGITTFNYDRVGNLTNVQATGGLKFNRNLAYDIDSRLILKMEFPDGKPSWQQSAIYVNGNQVALVGKENRFDMGEVGGNSKDADTTGGNYVVNAGDSLVAIAQNVWGDSTLWYLIADANGINVAPDAALTDYVGQNLKLPNVSRSNHNNATTFKPYNPAELIGDTTPAPQPPPPPKSKCGGIAMLVMVVVAVVVTVFTAGAALAAMGPILSAGVGAFAGSLASQVVGKAMGVVDSISLKQAFSAGIAGMITAGVGSALSSTASTSGSAFATTVTEGGKQVVQLTTLGSAIQGAAGVAAQYIGNKAAGLDAHFSWKNIAAGAVTGAASGALGLNNIKDPASGAPTTADFFKNFGAGFANGAISATTSRLMGVGGKQDWKSIAIDSFGNAIGNSLAVKFDLRRKGEAFGLSLTKEFKGLDGAQVAHAQDLMERFGLDMTDADVRKASADAAELYTDQKVFSGSERWARTEALMKLSPEASKHIDAVRNQFREAGLISDVQIGTIEQLPTSVEVNPSSNDAIQLETITVTAQATKPALGSYVIDDLAIGAGKIATEVAEFVDEKPWLKYSLMALDIAAGPAAFAVRKAISMTPIGEAIENAQSWVAEQLTDRFVKAGHEEPEAMHGGAGSTSLAMIGILGTTKAIQGLKASGIASRWRYMGRTPGKNSEVGLTVQSRMRAEGKLRDGFEGPEFQASNGKWYPLKEADMSHKTDAVTWWNETGRNYGARSSEVRSWMKDADNYYLDHYSINRSMGAKLKQTYLPPVKK